MWVYARPLQAGEYSTVGMLVLGPVLFATSGGMVPRIGSVGSAVVCGVYLKFGQLKRSMALTTTRRCTPTRGRTCSFRVLFFGSGYGGLFPPTVLPFSPRL